MRKTRRLPSVMSVRFWTMALVLVVVLVLLGAQLDHFWPDSPAWVRSLAAFGAVMLVGELWVRKYWPNLRRAKEEVAEVTVGLGALAVGLSVALGAIEAFWSVTLNPAPVAWGTYVCYLLLDASYQW